MIKTRASIFVQGQDGLSSICTFDISSIQEGDIILRKGNNFVSDLIVMAFPEGEDMSHCGVIVKKEDGFYVIHTISGRISNEDGIRISTLQDFIAHSYQNKFKIVRPINVYNTRIAASKAGYYLTQKVPFDHSFRLDNGNRFYCSELVRQVLLDAGSPDVFTYKQIGAIPVIDMASFNDISKFGLVFSSYE